MRQKATIAKTCMLDVRQGVRLLLRMGGANEGNDLKEVIRALAEVINPETDASYVFDVRRDLEKLQVHIEWLMEQITEAEIVRVAERVSRKRLPAERLAKIPSGEQGAINAAVAALQEFYRLYNEEIFGSEYESALLRARDSYLEKRRAIKKPGLLDLTLALAGMPYEL